MLLVVADRVPVLVHEELLEFHAKAAHLSALATALEVVDDRLAILLLYGHGTLFLSESLQLARDCTLLACRTRAFATCS